MSVEPILEEPVLPQSSGWMAAEEAPSGGVNPAGLERLTRLDLLLVTQQMEQLEAVVGLKLTNQYIVKNIRGEKVYFVAEDSNILERHLLGRCRPFHIRIFDEENHEIIHLQRRLRCSMCCFPCCLQKMTVESPPGKVIGYVKQTWTTCHPRFLVQDSSKKTLLYITGPVCPCGFCGHDKYRGVAHQDASQAQERHQDHQGLPGVTQHHVHSVPQLAERRAGRRGQRCHSVGVMA
ncbi:phospholipid scramblase 2-like isoform X2 [Gigantopelta aegis]|uniref:phospholipid scramblase 2-like isoform X2 n=1 Tax=Gigantopelta aegis TaxID=1735272 RepID=UPI001B88DE5B|nr:phospholipid scramblase 2-like isoform X2 [Gigantopelta aegis]